MATSSSPAEQPTVAVLGSASITQTDPRWEHAHTLGTALAKRGWRVLTGGYGGLMGAVADGAQTAGGHTIGLPMTPWHHLTPHSANTELRWSADYAERITHLLSTQVAIALPGGVGTLAEATMIWAAAQTEPQATQLILVGDAWQQLIDMIGQTFIISADDLTIPSHADDVRAIVQAVDKALTAPTQLHRAHG